MEKFTLTFIDGSTLDNNIVFNGKQISNNFDIANLMISKYLAYQNKSSIQEYLDWLNGEDEQEADGVLYTTEFIKLIISNAFILTINNKPIDVFKFLTEYSNL